MELSEYDALLAYSRMLNTSSVEHLEPLLADDFVYESQNVMQADHIEDHAAYIGHWITHLRRDPVYLFRAAAEAQLAVDFLLERGGIGMASVP